MRRMLVIWIVLFVSTVYGQKAPETYRFTTVYYYVDLKGQVGRREQISGLYTRDLAAKRARWSDVTMASGTKLEAFGPPSKRAYMEGFSYPLAAEVTKAGFFRDLHDSTMQDQNLVWDTRMFEVFGEDEFKHLKPNIPYHAQEGDVPLAGSGTFHNRNVELTWIGSARRGGRDCAVIDYRAFFNTFELQLPGEMTLTGRSHYWGQILVSLATKRIVYGTLYEDVLGEMTARGQAKPQPVNVFRSGVLELVRNP